MLPFLATIHETSKESWLRHSANWAHPQPSPLTTNLAVTIAPPSFPSLSSSLQPNWTLVYHPFYYLLKHNEDLGDCDSGQDPNFRELRELVQVPFLKEKGVWDVLYIVIQSVWLKHYRRVLRKEQRMMCKTWKWNFPISTATVSF